MKQKWICQSESQQNQLWLHYVKFRFHYTVWTLQTKQHVLIFLQENLREKTSTELIKVAVNVIAIHGFILSVVCDLLNCFDWLPQGSVRSYLLRSGQWFTELYLQRLLNGVSIKKHYCPDKRVFNNWIAHFSLFVILYSISTRNVCMLPNVTKP